MVKEIQYQSDKTLASIAKEIGYSTAYFTDQVNKGNNEEIRERLKRLLESSNKSEQNVPREKSHQASNKTNGAHIREAADISDHSDATLIHSNPKDLQIINLQAEIIQLQKQLQTKMELGSQDYLKEMKEDLISRIQYSLSQLENRILVQQQNHSENLPEVGKTPTVLQRTYSKKGSTQKRGS